MRTRKEIEKEIDDVVSFTQEYWYPHYERAEKAHQIDRGNTPTEASVIWEIISIRNRYVQELERQLLSHPGEEKVGEGSYSKDNKGGWHDQKID